MSGRSGISAVMRLAKFASKHRKGNQKISNHSTAVSSREARVRLLLQNKKMHENSALLLKLRNCGVPDKLYCCCLNGVAGGGRSSRQAAARKVEAVRQDGTLEVDMNHILEIARQPSDNRSIKDQDILAIWLFNKLRKNQLFDSITIAMCTQLAQDAEITSLSRSEKLFAEGDTGRNFFILLSGELQVLKGGPSQF